MKDKKQNDYLEKLRPWLLKYKGVDLGTSVENVIELNKMLLVNMKKEC